MERYGISKAEWDAMYHEQGGLCAICRSNEATLVDHCHATGTVRGLLCDRCNRVLGVVEANASVLTRVQIYKLTTGFRQSPDLQETAPVVSMLEM